MTIIEKMQQHASVRNFKDESLSATTKQQLLAAARSGSTSNHLQAYSIIEITDPQLRSELAEISQSASYVKQTGAFYVFVADLYRQAVLLEKQGEGLQGVQNMEALLVATVDTTIAAENMAVAAESLDLGICFIGGIRNDIQRVAELLHLPKYTVPLFGLTIGVPVSRNQVKPRFPQTNQVSENSYDQAAFTELSRYDEETLRYYAQRGSNQQTTSWSDKMVGFLKTERRPEVGAFLKKQGFTF